MTARKNQGARKGRVDLLLSCLEENPPGLARMRAPEDNPDDLLPQFFRVFELTHEGEYPTEQALEHVIGTMRQPGMQLVYHLRAGDGKVALHLGVAPAEGFSGMREQLADGSAMLMNGLKGGFAGSELVRLSDQETRDRLIEPLRKARRLAALTGVPAFAEDPKAREFQGMERLIHAMLAYSDD